MQVLVGKTRIGGSKWSSMCSVIKSRHNLNLTSNCHLYLLEGYEHLSASQKNIIKSLLQIDTVDPINLKDGVFVFPRKGTTSPWSSKTRDIFSQAGVNGISRIERGVCYKLERSADSNTDAYKILYDRMVESVIDFDNLSDYWSFPKEQTFKEINIIDQGCAPLKDINLELGLALSEEEIQQIYSHYLDRNKNPTDVELMTFAQVNSEHCRHKIFNASWVINGVEKQHSLFDLIRLTTKKDREHILSAYSDNAAVISGKKTKRLMRINSKYEYIDASINTAIKVETHNHPTAVSPYEGAATGVGGEIRDEAACGIGAKTKAGLCGFSVSSLCVPGDLQDYDTNIGTAPGKSLAFDIMQHAPIGSSRYSNEFGRPNVLGYFRSYCERVDRNIYLGYHKPVMLAGGIANIDNRHIKKRVAQIGDCIVVLGGPGFLIGIGGGSASSNQLSSKELDFSSVQRGNAEMQRRAQEVIDCFWSMGDKNPIISIHDVGAGGLSNAVPEIVYQSGYGAKINLRAIDVADKSMSPMQVWCNESQERYVILLSEDNLQNLESIAKRENCPYSVIGVLCKEKEISLEDPVFNNTVLHLDLDWLFRSGSSKTISIEVDDAPVPDKEIERKIDDQNFCDVAKKVLGHPTVASKKYLVTICDRSIGGLVAGEQMVGPYQVPVADCAVLAHSYKGVSGEAIAIGERPIIAKRNPEASVRMAVAESILNLLGADVDSIDKIVLSANWMVASHSDEKLNDLYNAVNAISYFCQKLNICIPVGKDSMSMTTLWDKTEVSSPVTMVASAFTQVEDIRKILTPYSPYEESNVVALFSLGKSQNLGGSIFEQVTKIKNLQVPDVTAEQVKNFFNFIKELKKSNLIYSYHDISDGGLFSSICEMAFACGYGFELSIKEQDLLSFMLNEEVSSISQLNNASFDVVKAIGEKYNITVTCLGGATLENNIKIYNNDELVFSKSLLELESVWANTSYRMQRLRDNPEAADSENQKIQTKYNNKIKCKTQLSFELPSENELNTFNIKEYKPWVAVLREQGTQGYMEMAAAFKEVGFRVKDVHMNDFLENRRILENCNGLVAAGGFSYGDVLGAGRGWANRILINEELQEIFGTFFSRQDTFSLGVCNGCQMLSQLRNVIPGANAWRDFLENESGQFESRVVNVKISKTSSILFEGMEGSVLPIVISHGEGRVSYNNDEASNILKQNLVAMQYVDDNSASSADYPYNPNGSACGITSLTTTDGRATIMMPHPERMFLGWQCSYNSLKESQYGPWMKMFFNARNFVN